MKIIQHDDWTLEVRPSGGIVVLLIGALFLLASPLMLYFLGQTSTLTCERIRTAEPTCVLARSLFGIELRRQSIGVVTGAHVSESTDSDGDTTYRVIIETQGGNVPLTSYSSSGYQKKAATVDEIQRFAVDSPATSLAVKAEGTLGLWVTGIMIAVDVVMVLLGLQMTGTSWTFSRDTQQITRRRRGPLGAGLQAFPMGDVVDVRLGSSRDSDGDRTYRIELITNAGSALPLTNWYSSGYKRKQEAVNAIRTFMRLEP